jgi:putative transposase
MNGATATLRCDTAAWKPLSLAGFTRAQRKKVLARQGAVDAYYHRIPLREIQKRYRIVPSEVIRWATRCASYDEQGKQVEWRGLLPREVLKDYRRHSAVNEALAERGRGLSGMFGDLLRRHRPIEAGLRKKLLQKGNKGEVFESRVSLKTLFREFRKLCREAGVRDDQYPFITKGQGYRSLGTWLRQQLTTDFKRVVATRFGEVAASHTNVGTGHPARRRPTRVFEQMQLDGFDLPMIATVAVPTHRGVRDIPVDRIWIILLVDVNCPAVFGYSVSIRRELTDDDVLECFTHAMTPWKPLDVAPFGLKYPKFAGFPSALSPLILRCGCSTLFVDNAEIHLGPPLARRIRARMGCEINWGPVRRWDRRPVVERLGGMAKREGFVRVPSSMGTGPQDPLRKDPVGTAVRKKIRIEKLLALIDVEQATINGLQTEGLCNISPLEYLQQLIEDDSYFWPVLPDLPEGIADLNTDVLTVRVSGDPEDGRRAHFKIDRVPYTNEVIAASPELIGKQVLVHFPRKDLRAVEVFNVSGEPLGTALASGHWGETPHSRETRKLVNSLKDRRLLQLTADDDPICQLVDHLSEEARKEARTRPNNVSHAGTVLARVIEETGRTPSIPHSAPSRKPLTLREEFERRRSRA